MTIDEAIKNAEEIAETKEWLLEDYGNDDSMGARLCRECAEEHRQLAEWLRELKAYKEQTDGDLISREEIIIKAKEEAKGMEEPFKSNFAILVEWLVEKLPSVKVNGNLISRQAVIQSLKENVVEIGGEEYVGKGVCEEEIESIVNDIPSAEKTAEWKDMGEVSDGYHTFNQLYHQRAILFATIVNQNKNISWKSFKHEDGNYCFDSNGEWFIVGIDTPKGSYTYHYEKKYWDYFKCKELETAKHWDGHTEEDVIRLLSLGDKNDL